MYIYPENLKAKATLWLWTLRDITIIGAAAFLSIVILAQTGVIIPLVLTFLYAFLCIRVEDSSILDFICHAAKFLFLQQYFEWGRER